MLKGFAKVNLDINESKVVNIIIKKEELKYWDIDSNQFVLEDGEYKIEVGKNSRDIVLSENITLKGERVKSQEKNIYHSLEFNKMNDEEYEKIWNIKISPLAKVKPFTLESQLVELKQSFMGKILFNAVLSVARKDLKAAKKMPEGPEKDNKIKGAYFLEKILVTNSLRSMSMSSSGAMPYNFAEGFRDLSNGHLIKGIKDFTKKIKAPALPIDNKEEK